MKARLSIALLILLLLLPAPATARPATLPTVRPASGLQLSTTDGPSGSFGSRGLAAQRLTTAAQATPGNSRIEPALLKQLLAASDGGTLRAIAMIRAQGDPRALPLVASDRAARGAMVQEHLHSLAERTQGNVRRVLERAQQEGRVHSYRPFWIVNAIALEAHADALWALAAHPDVSLLLQDRVHRLPDEPSSLSIASTGVQWNIARIGADQVWQSLGITGQGTVVASLDTGVDWEHPYLRPRYRGYSGKPLVEHEGNWFCATDEDYVYPGDGHGHGTHTTGTMVGESGIGVAPGAQWIAAKVFDNQGLAYDSWIHAALEWALAPGGDPSLAPDVVNGSWGDPNGANSRFLPDVQALRAAGIVPIFSAGNYGPGEATIAAPGSFRESIAVGATDVNDLVARFSSRGPSAWDEVKPEISAPGVGVLSALPGGGLGEKSGTSMAAPHVSGLVALLREANPSLTVDEIEVLLTTTAHPLGTVQPNNDTGWGLIDARAAVVLAGSYGYLTGQVTDGWSGSPISGVLVRAVAHDGVRTFQTVADASGAYTLGLGADLYDVTFTAFGYEPNSVYGVEVSTGATTRTDAALLPLSTGQLAGHVWRTDPELPLEARVFLPGTHASTTSVPSNGAYALTLPVGTHVVRVEAQGHRFVTRTVAIHADQTTAADFALEPAPSILIVDTGAWYNGSQVGYYREALEHLRYLHDEHAVHNIDLAPTDVPTGETLHGYDLVIWSAPLDSPGYIGASGAVTAYLSAGGRLLLSGQDVAFWDSGASGATYAPYLEDYLYTHLVADEAASHIVLGEGNRFAGLSIAIAGPGGADNQDAPDVISSAGPDYAAPAWRYEGDGWAALSVGPCLPYRALLFGFGLEGVSGLEARGEVLGRSIEWLTGPLDPVGVELIAGTDPQIAPPGGPITHAFRVRNTGEVTTDTLALALQSGTWPLTDPLPPSVSLGACQSATLSVGVRVPAETGWHEYDAMTVTATSALSPALNASASLHTKTPAPLLLVDGSRFYHVDARYRAALDGAGIAYDYHRIKGNWPPAVPTTQTLSMYPMLVWYTAYDWYRPLSAEEEQRLMGYLDGGGRLFLSSQDYLYYGQSKPLATSYLGVLTHLEDLETAVVWGEAPHPIAWGLGPYTLHYTYTNWSDGLRAVDGAQVVLRGQHGRPAAISQQGPHWRTAFAAFPFETLAPDPAQALIGRIAGWLSWLGRSTWTASPRVIHGGHEVTMTARLHNDGWSDVAAHFTAPLPRELDLVAGSLSEGALYHAPTRTISWAGGLTPGQTVTVRFRVDADQAIPAGAAIPFPATIGYAEHGLLFDLPCILQVDAPDLSSSVVSLDPGAPTPFRPLTYLLRLRNEGLSDAVAVVSGTLPQTATFTGALGSGGIGVGTAVSRTLEWAGPVPAGGEVALTYSALPNGETGYWLIHDLRIADQFEDQWYLEARAYVVPYIRYFPLIAR